MNVGLQSTFFYHQNILCRATRGITVKKAGSGTRDKKSSGIQAYNQPTHTQTHTRPTRSCPTPIQRFESARHAPPPFSGAPFSTRSRSNNIFPERPHEVPEVRVREKSRHTRHTTDKFRRWGFTGMYAPLLPLPFHNMDGIRRTREGLPGSQYTVVSLVTCER